ncbi:MAG: ATPase, partial [Candidatus Latescibacterota bacterium]
MKPWWQVVVPHKDIKEGKFDESVFACDLADVVKMRAPSDYLDPEIFFKKTYFTAKLKMLLKDILLRISGKQTQGSVIQLTTPFGGGKTHSLLCLYHLFKNKEKVKNLSSIKELLDECGLSDIPEVKVCVFVGIQQDVLRGRSPWGEIFYQLGVYQEYKEYDKKYAPGKEILLKIFQEKGPDLILMDEIVEYALRASIESESFKEAFVSFFHQLTVAIPSTKNSSLVVALPSSALESYGEKGERILRELQKIIGREEKVYTLVEGDEKYEIIRKRLFESLGDVNEHNIIAQKYFEMYLQAKDSIPAFAVDASYKERIKKAYPFHPETIDILFERWSTISTFQRTRGVLRLLALIVSNLYKKRELSYLIHPSNIDLKDSSIKAEFLKHIDSRFGAIIDTDIIEKSSKIDKEIGSEFEKFKVATSLATSIFFYTFSGAVERKGTSISRIRLSLLQEGIPLPIIGDTLKRLEEKLYYLKSEGNIYYFDTEPNLNMIIVERQETIKDEDVELNFKNEIKNILGKEFEAYLFPTTSQDIPDNTKLKLIILKETPPNDYKNLEEFCKEIFDKYSQSFRVYKNTLIFVLPTRDEVFEVKNIIKNLLALQSIKNDDSLLNKMSSKNKKILEEKFRKIKSDLPYRIFSLYRKIYVPTKEGLKLYDLGMPVVGESLNLSLRIKEFLKEQEIMINKLDYNYISKNILASTEKKTFKEIKEVFYKFPGFPIPEDETVLKHSIAQGVNLGTIGLKKQDKTYFKKTISLYDIKDEDEILPSDMVKDVSNGPKPPPPPP